MQDQRKDIIAEIKDLTQKLNCYRDLYYNKQQPAISDYEYDWLFDRLQELEEEANFRLSTSPTETVGYEVKSELRKVKHDHPMLSLGKTKNIKDLIAFSKKGKSILMLKMDGLTISLRYSKGKLVAAETRGNGEIGEDVLHTVKTFANVPLQIRYDQDLVVDGEAIVDYDTFAKITEALSPDEQYKTPRNLASGSVRQLNAEVCAERGLSFVAWKCVAGLSEDSFSERLIKLGQLGFSVVPFADLADSSEATISSAIEVLKGRAESMHYPIDGMVISYDDIQYGESLGMTGHHPKNQLAYKFYDEEVETEFKEIQWTIGKTGVLTPTAVFDTIEIDGTEISRASVHNLRILKKLNLHPGDHILVYKANQIIPQIRENLNHHSEPAEIPATCPYCGHPVKIVTGDDSEVLYCSNPKCAGVLIEKLSHFASREAVNIDGLSKATIKQFVKNGWLEKYEDFFHLQKHRDEMLALNGFGEKSVDKLLKTVEKSRHITLDRFLYSLSIPLIGRTASRSISKLFQGDAAAFLNAFRNDGFDWTVIDDFGSQMDESMHRFASPENIEEVSTLMKFFVFERPEQNTTDKLKGMVFVITGELQTFENRDEAKQKIESVGGKVSGSVSKKTSYLVTNDPDSGSLKCKKAKELNIPIISEEQLKEML